MHADARCRLTGARSKQFGPETGFDLLLGAHGLFAHSHDFRAEGQYIAFLIQRTDIALYQLALVLAHLDKMRLHGLALIALSVAALEYAAIIINDAVLLAPCFFLVA